jgi:hypothetical protein
MVARAHFDDMRANPLDDSGALVSEHDRVRHRVNLIANDHVCVAHARRDNAHQYFVVARFLEPQFLDDERAALFAYDCGAHGICGSVNGH